MAPLCCSTRRAGLAFSAGAQCHPASAVRPVLAASSAREASPAPAVWLQRVQQACPALVLSAVLLTAGLPAPPAALAVPQTSACATAACDGQDLSNKDLRKEFYTKGSLKAANFSHSNLKAVTLFGANLEGANLEGADLTYSNLGQANLDGANLSQAILNGAIMSSARFDGAILDGADFTDVIIRKDVNDKLCRRATGVNAKTGVDTRESLNCF